MIRPTESDPTTSLDAELLVTALTRRTGDPRQAVADDRHRVLGLVGSLRISPAQHARADVVRHLARHSRLLLQAPKGDPDGLFDLVVARLQKRFPCPRVSDTAPEGVFRRGHQRATA